tara:strand:- start:2033 stop:2758 length:726 start_codon:yes stop_codon:yes gene_type:complete
MSLEILGSKGKLSKELLRMAKNNEKKILQNNKNIKQRITLKVATYSPTLRNDSITSFLQEKKYYENLLKSLTKYDHLIYISSQTLELTNLTFYSKSKLEIENLIKNNLMKYTIIRPGMIFNKRESRYILENMNTISKSIFSFNNDFPKTTVCSIEDIYKLILYISNNLNFFTSKTINLGIKRYRFFSLQNLANKKRFRIMLLTFGILKFLSIFNVRLKSYCKGKANSNSPNFAWESSYEEI